jgi:hypothetical protein
VPQISLTYTISGDGTKWIVCVASVEGKARETDLYLVIGYANGTQAIYKQLSTFTSGTAVNDVTYYDSTNNAILDSGDYFTLDSSTYSAGTIFELIHINGLAIFVVLAAIHPIVGLTTSISGDGTKWIISVVSVQGTALESDLYLKITYENGTQAMYKQLSTFTSGTAVCGVAYYDSTNDDTLDPGDYFTLDKTSYPSGTIFELIHINGLAGSVTL